jgi:phenylacetate-CoA ligase
VVDRYANEECGVLAFTRPDGDLLGLNGASYHFELLELESDRPAQPGALARIVLTDLYNRAMPLIRYDTGDLGVVAEADERGPRSLSSVQGRSSDVIRATDGGLVSAPMVSALMAARFPEIAQYQLVQVAADRYRLALVMDGARYEADDVALALREFLGADARVEVAIVGGIVQGPTGKRRVVYREPAGAMPGDPPTSALSVTTVPPAGGQP